jgi:hypothetical protein
MEGPLAKLDRKAGKQEPAKHHEQLTQAMEKRLRNSDNSLATLPMT